MGGGSLRARNDAGYLRPAMRQTYDWNGAWGGARPQGQRAGSSFPMRRLSGGPIDLNGFICLPSEGEGISLWGLGQRALKGL